MSQMSIHRPSQPVRYEIRLQGHLDPRWATWFDGMSLTTESDGTTLLSGPVADQAALHGLLHRVRDVALPLISVRQVRPELPAPPLPSDPDPSIRTRRPT